MIGEVYTVFIDDECLVHYYSDTDFGHDIHIGEKCAVTLDELEWFIGTISEINDNGFVLDTSAGENIAIRCEDICDIYCENDIGPITDDFVNSRKIKQKEETTMETRKEQLEMIKSVISNNQFIREYEIWEYDTYYAQKKHKEGTGVLLEKGCIDELENSQYLQEEQVVSAFIIGLFDSKLILLLGKMDEDMKEIKIGSKGLPKWAEECVITLLAICILIFLTVGKMMLLFGFYLHLRLQCQRLELRL